MYHYAIGHEIKTLSHLITRECDAIFKERGVDNATGMHAMIVKFLLENKDKHIYQRDIEAQFEITRSTVTNILQLMEKKEYITRTDSKSDARMKRLELTEKGIELASRVDQIFFDFETILRTDIDETEINSFINTIQKIKGNLGEIEAERKKHE